MPRLRQGAEEDERVQWLQVGVLLLQGESLFIPSSSLRHSFAFEIILTVIFRFLGVPDGGVED